MGANPVVVKDTTCETLKTLARKFAIFGDLGEREARHSGAVNGLRRDSRHRSVLQVVLRWPPSPLDSGEEGGRGTAAGDRHVNCRS